MPSMTDASGTAHTGGIIVTCNYTAITSGVTFDANGGKWSDESTSKEVSQTYGSTYSLPADPSRTGYTFVGWFTGQEDGTQITDKTEVKITSGTTYYAH